MAHHRLQVVALAVGISWLFGAGAAQAQRAGMVGSARVAPVRTRSAPPATVRATKRAPNASPRVHSRVQPADFFGSGSFDFFSPFGAMGFGDFGVQNLQNQDLGIKAAIDPATQWRLFEARRFLRGAGFVGPGFYLLDDGAYYEVPPDSGEADQSSPPLQQPVVIVQAPQARQPAETSEQPAPEEASAPLADVGQFVIVLRNGAHVLATAFTRKDDRIVYITTDGLRRTLALADVDTQSTIRINQERGTPVDL